MKVNSIKCENDMNYTIPTSMLAKSLIGTSFVYPQAGDVITIDQMEHAFIQLKNGKLKNYPKCKTLPNNSIVALEVYCNRIFAFTFQKLIKRNKGRLVRGFLVKYTLV